MLLIIFKKYWYIKRYTNKFKEVIVKGFYNILKFTMSVYMWLSYLILYYFLRVYKDK